MTTRTFLAPLVGMRFRPPAEDVVAMLPGGTKLRAELQPDNPYDEDAVAVFLDGFNSDDDKLGTLYNALFDTYSNTSTFVDPLMLGFVANSEKTGGKFASAIKAYLQLDGRTGVDCTLAFDSHARPALEFEWDSEATEKVKEKLASPLETVEKKSLKEDLNDDIPF